MSDQKMQKVVKIVLFKLRICCCWLKAFPYACFLMISFFCGLLTGILQSRGTFERFGVYLLRVAQVSSSGPKLW